MLLKEYGITHLDLYFETIWIKLASAGSLEKTCHTRVASSQRPYSVQILQIAYFEQALRQRGLPVAHRARGKTVKR